MVKADNRRNYYEDLELKPSADANEVKKQFKKLALKYHPDRNPGREVEFNAKFQAIQSAHEVLTDPQLRAKYDADRIRAGMLHTYTSPPSRPNMPPRSAATNFGPPPPPPPRPPPPSATKSNFAPPLNRYSKYPRPEPGVSGSTTAADDARAKVNKFKAWDQLKHGQGQTPQGRGMPHRSPKTSTFQSSTQGGNGIPNDPPRKGSGWDHFQEPNASFPRMSRTGPTRGSQRAPFGPSTPGVDEPQPRYDSAYSNVFKGERPARPGSNFMPSPGQGTSPRKPDPLGAFRSQLGTDESYSKSARVSTPYATAGGEKTYFSSTGLGRSASTRVAKDNGEWYDSEPMNNDGPQPQMTSATSGRQHHSASPKTRSPMQQQPSFSSSSSSSSEESNGEKKNFYSSARKYHETQRTQAHNSQARNAADGHRRPGYKPSVQVEEAVDEDVVPPTSGDANSTSMNDAWKRQSADQIPQDPTSDYPEGFLQHRAKRNSDRSQHLSSGLHPTPAGQDSPGHEAPQPPLRRPKSWHDRSTSVEGDNGQDSTLRPATGHQRDNSSMYDSSGYTPSSSTSSNKWSDQWPFSSLKRPRTSSALPPYWAIPSVLCPRRQSDAQGSSNNPFRFPTSSQAPTQNVTDRNPFHSFTIPVNEINKAYTGAPSLRSHSSDTINMDFSPSEWPGKFTGNGNKYFAPPPTSRANTPRGKTSPIRSQMQQQRRQQVTASNVKISESGNTTMPPTPTATNPPPPVGPAGYEKYSSEEWAQHFRPATFTYPPPPPMSTPNRTTTTKKRPMAATKAPKNAHQRPPGPTNTSAPNETAGDEQEAASVASLSSRTGADESAMDIDPALTPPSAQQPQINGNTRATVPIDRTDTTPRPTGPPIPPRVNGHASLNTDTPHMNLGDLKNVAPFATNDQGIKDLNDLSTTLPFESRSSINPFNIHTPQPLILPNPPKAVPVPEKLSQTSWERYTAQMRGYMFEWNTYNTKMLSHFNERQQSIGGLLKPEWMSAIGDGTEKWGYKKYMQGVEEDFRVREHWDVSWERHRECMRGLGTVREKLLGSAIAV